MAKCDRDQDEKQNKVSFMKRKELDQKQQALHEMMKTKTKMTKEKEVGV